MEADLKFIGLLLSLTGLLGVAGPVAPCDPDGPDFCALERAEDIALVPGTDWFAVSTSSQDAPLVFIDARTKQRTVLQTPFVGSLAVPSRSQRHAGRAAPVSAPDCPGPPTQFRAGGNDIRRVAGELHMAVINRVEPGAQHAQDIGRVELFSLQLRAGIPAARWLGCFPVPPPYLFNDVAIAADGAIYASHQFDRPRSPADAATTREKWLSGTPTGYGMVWQRGAGWTPVRGTEVSFANGVAVSLDEREFATAGTYSSAVILVDRRSGAVRRVPIPLTPDNITPLAGGGFLVVGHTGVPVTGVDPCRDPSAVPCGFPFAVARIDRAARVSVLFEHDGRRIPGASVAVLHRGRLFLGSYFGDRVTVIDPGQPGEIR